MFIKIVTVSCGAVQVGASFVTVFVMVRDGVLPSKHAATSLLDTTNIFNNLFFIMIIFMLFSSLCAMLSNLPRSFSFLIPALVFQMINVFITSATIGFSFLTGINPLDASILLISFDLIMEMLGVMNIFRFLADLSHLLAIVLLCHKIWKSRSCEGISGRSQLLFALVFTTRYLDLFTNFVSVYNTVMKLFFLGSSFGVIYLMWFKFKATYDRNNDNFRIELLALPAFLLALLLNHEFSFMEVAWTFSIYLESVAIMPQLYMLVKTGNAEIITVHYLLCLGLYRALYIVNWVYRYYTENFFDIIAVIAGIVQTVLYTDLFYLYVTRVINARRNFEMPA